MTASQMNIHATTSVAFTSKMVIKGLLLSANNAAGTSELLDFSLQLGML